MKGIYVKFGASLRERDAYPEQFRTEKSLFTTFWLVSSSQVPTEFHGGNAKDEDLNKLGCDSATENS